MIRQDNTTAGQTSLVLLCSLALLVLPPQTARASEPVTLDATHTNNEDSTPPSLTEEPTPPQTSPDTKTNEEKSGENSASEKDEQQRIKFDNYSEVVHVNPDGTASANYQFRMTALTNKGLEDIKTIPINYSTSAERVENISAYTLKADGRTIPVPDNNFQSTVNGGKKDASPAFTDRSTIAILFPDLEVGDTIAFGYTAKLVDPMFPGQYSDAWGFNREHIYNNVSISIDFPASMKPRFAAWGGTKAESLIEGDRQVIRWTFSNPAPDDTPAPSLQLVEDPTKEPGFAVSTFTSYREMAEAYGKRALPKAIPTDSIRKLASKIVEGKNTEREKIKAIYEWISENITYGGNTIGVGAVVPRDLDFVVNNKIGDCKDHATLFQAMLASQNIESTQALVSTDPVYTLPPIPYLSVVDHVINYIPSLDMFIDTTHGTPFGTIPPFLNGKPTLLATGYIEGKTLPLHQPKDDTTELTSHITINNDRSITARETYRTIGLSAYFAMMRTKNTPIEEFERNYTRALNEMGFANSQVKVSQIRDTENLVYSMTIESTIANYIPDDEYGSIAASPILIPSATITNYLGGSDTPLKKDFYCTNGTAREDITFTFPENWTILSTPKPLDIDIKLQKYTANTTRNGRTIQIHRSFEDVTPGPTCKPEISDQYNSITPEITRNVRSKIFFRQEKSDSQ